MKGIKNMGDSYRWTGEDGGLYKNIFERDAANTRYRQQEAIKAELKRQNEIAIENAEMIAQATLEAEMERYNNELDLEEQRYNNKKLIEEQRFEHEKELRLYKLCDDYSLDYNDIKTFNVWLNLPSIDVYSEYLESIKKEVEFLSTD